MMPRFCRCSWDAPSMSWEGNGSCGDPAPGSHHSPAGSVPSMYLIVDVEIPLALVLAHHPGLLQQKIGDLPPVGFTAPAELDLEVLPLSQDTSRSEPRPWPSGLLTPPSPGSSPPSPTTLGMSLGPILAAALTLCTCPGDLRSGWSCCSGQFWHFRRLPAAGWTAG